jgi:hypothetical protein
MNYIIGPKPLGRPGLTDTDCPNRGHAISIDNRADKPGHLAVLFENRPKHGGKVGGGRTTRHRQEQQDRYKVGRADSIHRHIICR